MGRLKVPNLYMAATTGTLPPQSIPLTRVSEKAVSIPWYVWCAVLGATSAMIGGHWDVSWHSSIGRDTFWTPAHIAIYMCGVLTGLAFGYLILTTTFNSQSPLRAASVRVLGFYGPLGAFIGAWGGLTMLTSAPFDNWWHNAYGLDVQIVSPPHMILFLGVYSVLSGTLVLLAGHGNRAQGAEQRRTQALFVYVCGLGLVMLLFMLMEFTGRSRLHTSLPYVLVSLVAPIPMAVAARATRFRFPITAVAAIYTFVLISLILVLPLFPAQPKLGPVYQNVTHFIPPQFPLLLIVPALALDLLWQRARNWNKWVLSFVSAALFLALLLAVEWPFAAFLNTPAAGNRFFGANYFWYGLSPASYMAQHKFYNGDTVAAFWRGICIALVVGTLGMRFGISRGDWMQRIKR
jgi:hypothetical protein